MLARELEDLRAGILLLDCPMMALSNGDEGRPRRFAGPGRLSLDENGQLQLVLYDPGHDLDLTELLHNSTVGGWLAESEKYDLEAADLSGRIWSAQNLTPGVHAHVAHRGAIVYAHLHCLSSESAWDRAGKDWISLFFPLRIEAPSNVSTVTTVRETDTDLSHSGSKRDIWAISCGDLTVRARFREGGFEINGTSSAGTFDQDLGAIIEEAMWFTLGQPLRADIIQYRMADKEGIRIHSRGRDDELASAMPPYHIGISDSAKVLGEIFCKYLVHVSRERSDRYHPLSVLIRKALRAEAGTIEELALARSVAIEGIVDLAFARLGKADKEVLEAVSALEELLDEHLKSSVIKDRVRGCLAAIRRPSSRTALRSLVRDGVITKEQLDAWETLRHVAAHGQEYQLPYREIFELSEHLRVLMARLVFEQIAYRGAYTDYGTPSWPTRQHVVEPSKDVSSAT